MDEQEEGAAETAQEQAGQAEDGAQLDAGCPEGADIPLAPLEEAEPLVDEDAEDLRLMEELAAEETSASEETAINEDPEAQPAPPAPEDMSQWDLLVLFDDLLVQQVDAPTHAQPGGKIELSDAYKDRHRPLEGLVMLVGEGKPLQDGSLRAPRVRVGDRVHYGPHSGSDLVLPDGRRLVVLKEDEVLALWRERAPERGGLPEPEPPSAAPLSSDPNPIEQ